MVIKTLLSAESCAAQQEAERCQSWDCAKWRAFLLKLGSVDKTCQGQEKILFVFLSLGTWFCLCVCHFRTQERCWFDSHGARTHGLPAEHAQSWQQQDELQCAWKGHSPAQSLHPTGARLSQALSSLLGTQQLCIQCAKSFWESGYWLWQNETCPWDLDIGYLPDMVSQCQSWLWFHWCEHLLTKSKTERHV